MLKLDDNAVATLKDAQAALKDHEKLHREIDKLTVARRELTTARNTSKASIEKLEGQLERGDAGVAGRLAEARSAMVRQELAIGGVDEEMATLVPLRQASNQRLGSLGAAIKGADMALRAQVIDVIQKRFEPLAEEMAAVVKFGLAISHGLGVGGYRSTLIEAKVPALDRWDRPLLDNGRLRRGAPDGKGGENLEQTWQLEPELIALSETLADFSATARLMAGHAQRISAEHEATLRDDPVAWAAHQEELRKRRAAEEEERVHQAAEARAKREQEEEERQALFAERVRSGEIVQHGIVREPGTPAPGQSQAQFDAEQDRLRRDTADRRARVAAEALRAEAALNDRVADSEPAAA